MRSFSISLFVLLIAHNIFCQQQVISISRCGGADSLSIPSIIDNDNDGMDDILEQKLIEKFMPSFIQFSGDNCPGPAVNGTGDTNLVVCHIFPLPQQYARTSSLDSILIKPKQIAPRRGLTVGLVWHNTTILINAALLYGKDCGLNGHNADVEGFTYSLKYIGADTLAGWRYDTVMQNWIGGIIQTFSHAGTICEKIETKPYKSALNPTGVDSIFASPSKHGNYLTVGGCNSSFICDPGCSGTQTKKKVMAVNIGEESAPLVSDLGVFYAGYAGENPWSNAKFLASQNGSAGAIKDKMNRKLQSQFFSGTPIANQAQICAAYKTCYGIFSSNQSVSICSGSIYTFNGKQLTQNGLYSDTILNVNGCDSIASLQLTVKQPSSFSFSEKVCGGFQFNNKYLTAPGSYTDTILNANGCDSIIQLQLNVTQTSSSTISAKICADSTFVFNGNAITTQGIYNDTLLNSLGCDSIVTLQLIVDDPQVSWSNIADTTYTNNNVQILVGGTPFGGTYSGTGVSGNYFYPDVAGNGIHEITYSFINSTGCTGTAKKYFAVGISSIKNTLRKKYIEVFPNPVVDFLFIKNNQHTAAKFELYDAAGKKVFSADSLKNDTTRIDMSQFQRGIYFLTTIGLDGENHFVIIH
jgi:hypothetical protein